MFEVVLNSRRQDGDVQSARGSRRRSRSGCDQRDGLGLAEGTLSRKEDTSFRDRTSAR